MSIGCAKTRHQPVRKGSETEGKWDEAAVAGLSPQRIASLTVHEMMEVIETARPPFLHDYGESRRLSEASLETLVYLARRHCRMHLEQSGRIEKPRSRPPGTGRWPQEPARPDR